MIDIRSSQDSHNTLARSFPFPSMNEFDTGDQVACAGRPKEEPVLAHEMATHSDSLFICDAGKRKHEDQDLDD
jgi:hypothetical protein